MPDREKIIKWLEYCVSNEDSCSHCPYEKCFSKGWIVALREDVLELLKEQPAKDTNVPSKWISVKDRLPDNNDTMLIVHRGGVSFGWYNGRYWERGASTNHRQLRTVTHWMPFPEPPEVK